MMLQFCFNHSAKKNYQNLILVIALFFSTNLCGEIFNIQTLEELLKHDFNESLIIFDINETLISYQEMVGRAYVPVDANESFFTSGRQLTFAQWKQLQNSLGIELVEEAAPAIIRRLQKKANYITCLCPNNCSVEWVKDKLKNLGFTITENFLTFTESNKHQISTADDLNSQIKQLKESPSFNIKEIIFISSNESLLAQIQKTCFSQDIPLKGFKFNGGKKCCYNSAIAKVQLTYFDQILSNQDAEKILAERHKLCKKSHF